MQNECPGCAVRRGEPANEDNDLCARHAAALEKLTVYRMGEDQVSKRTKQNKKEPALVDETTPGHVPHGILIDENAEAAAAGAASDAMPWEGDSAPKIESAQAQPSAQEAAKPAEPPRGSHGRVLKERAPEDRLRRARDAKKMIERFVNEASTKRWDWAAMGVDPGVVEGQLLCWKDIGAKLKNGGATANQIVEGAFVQAKTGSELAEAWQALYGTPRGKILQVVRNEQRQLKRLVVDVDSVPTPVFGASLRQLELADAEDEDDGEEQEEAS
jgi:hypothetical protein